MFPKRPAPFAHKSDFSLAFLLSVTDFRFGKYIYRKLQSLVFDDELSAGMEKINRFYLPLIVATAGILGVVGLTIGKLTDTAVLLAILGWLVLDILLVSPLIYLAFLPKPVWRHIRDIESLSVEELEYYEELRGRNPRIDKMMAKYTKNHGSWQ